MLTFWTATLYELEDRCQSFGETYYLHIHGWMAGLLKRWCLPKICMALQRILSTWFLHHEGNVSRFEWSAVELLIPSFNLWAYVQTLQSICSCTQAGVNCIVHYVREVAIDGSTRLAVSWSRLGLAAAFWRLTRQTDHLDHTKLFAQIKSKSNEI
jgi:hypothetical protein